VDTRGVVSTYVFDADQDLVGRIGSEDRGEYGDQDQRDNDAESDHSRLASSESTHGEAPLAQRLFEQSFGVECLTLQLL